MKFRIKCALIALAALNFFTFSQQFDSQVFKERRDKLASEITDGIIVMQSAPVYNRNGDVDHDYRQSSDFYYLTGFEEQPLRAGKKSDVGSVDWSCYGNRRCCFHLRGK